MCRVQWNPIHVLVVYTCIFLSYHVYDTSALPVDNNRTGVVPFVSMTATSIYDELHAASDVILDNSTRAWCAGNYTSHQYIQIKLGSVFALRSIATQGLRSTNISGHVTAYKMKFSLDSRVWYGYQENNQSNDKIFPGNKDAVNISHNRLNEFYNESIMAKFVRIYPVKWANHICMRVGLTGVLRNCSSSHSLCSANTSYVKNLTDLSCPRGFYGDGQNCTDIDECMVNNTCQSNSKCVNTLGSFNCVCALGYYGNTSKCLDIDECLTRTHSCSPYAQCSNTDGSYTCRCNGGYYGNGHACLDVDECEGNLHNCHDNTSCINTQGSYTCTCISGYRGDGYDCTDIDECTLSHRICSKHAVCTNVPGSFYCTCTEGYSSMHDGHNCTAVSVAGQIVNRSYLGIAIGLPVILVVIVTSITVAYIVIRHRRRRVLRRPKSPNNTGSRPSSTVIGQIDKLFDNDERKLRDSVSLRSLQFSIPSVHPSLTALNNIGLTTKNSPYETLQA